MSWVIEHQQEGTRGCFPPFLLCLYREGWVWAEKTLFERMLTQSGNNFSFLGLSCCEAFSTNNLILEKKSYSHLEIFRHSCFDSSAKLTALKAWKRGLLSSTSSLFFLIVIQMHGTNTQCWTISLALMLTVPTYLYVH